MISTFTILKLGDVIELEGREHVIAMVNESRAKAIPLQRETRTFTPSRYDAQTGEQKKVQFLERATAANISPNSDVPILRTLSSADLEKFLGGKYRRPAETQPTGEQPTVKEESTEIMKTAEKPIRSPRGGLAAISKTIAKTSKAPKASKSDKAKPSTAKTATAKPATAKPATAKPSEAPERKQSKCGLIDELFEKGGLTKKEILAKVLEAFPGSDPKGTAATINVRPSHMKKAGKQAKWVEETKA
jgi:hypothetical protein